MSSQLDWAALQREAGRRFGVRKFRPGQRELMEAVLRGRDALGMLPTGGGKSLTYQIPALFLPRAVVVVSPLLSLMQDQREKAEAARIEVAKLDSTLSTSEERDAVEQIASGANDLIYVTPERLENPEHVAPLRERGVSLLVVDEAHCVSQWGHDFRPAYLALAEAARALGRPPILALTATATPEVVEDIVRQLGMKEVEIVHTGVDRPNLFIEVRRTVNRAMKEQALLEALRREEGPGIVYCATVRKVEELYRWLRGQGAEVGRYHGQLAAAEREEMQRRFMSDDLRVVVATNAFGLGIDKPDIRFVAHWNFPGSVEAWYQEAGRAGRDGEPARVTLLYRLEDKRIQSYFLGGKYPSREESQMVFRAIGAGKSAKAIADAVELGEKRVKVIVAQLVGAGVVERRGRSLVRTGDLDAEALAGVLSAYEERQTGDRERLETMMRFAQSALCRWRLLREYFGEERGEDCGNCDNCRSGMTRLASERPLRDDASP
ncbi:MAG TPA: ATP-dependent DNA helicase RecQ [Myxococcales bacterium]|nr:ATP-dependent DNA helicase RecQ [Myxococcales bacterium]